MQVRTTPKPNIWVYSLFFLSLLCEYSIYVDNLYMHYVYQ